MKYSFVLSVVFFASFIGTAHESNEAFFKIVQKENTVEIEAEFPWSIRNALLAFDPSLENATRKKDFENTFVRYIKANLILKSRNGELLEFLEFQEIENNGHSHQNKYILLFKGKHLAEITNTMMFNINESQVNYTSLSIGAIEKNFETKPGQEQYTITKKSPLNYWWFLLLFLPIYFWYRSTKK